MIKRHAISFIGSFLGVSLILAGILTVLVLRENPVHFGFKATLELGLAMLWVSLALNAVFGAVLLLLWLPLRFSFRRQLKGSFTSFFLGGLVSCNVVWNLWNRLAMANSFASGKSRFMTWSSLVELTCLALIGFGLLLAALGLCSGADDKQGGVTRKAGLVGLLFALAAGYYAFNLSSREEAFHRMVSHERIASAARAATAPANLDDGEHQQDQASELRVDAHSQKDADSDTDSGAESGADSGANTAAGRRIVTIGADGMDWSVLVPLMEGGYLPNFARLIDGGAIGYLDNGNESYSPVIWTTMYTGFPGQLHGIFDFQKAVLPGGRAAILNPLLMPPTIDTFHGLKTLLGNSVLQRLGLWHMEWVGARDRRLPTVWDVASQYGKHVAICDALANLPARPVNGAIINLGRQKGAGSSAFHPPELHERWREARTPDPQFEDSAWGRFNALAERFDDEVSFALDILDEYGTDFCFYYTYFADSQCHSGWNFYAPDKYFLSDLPRDLDDGEWDAFVLAHAEERAIKAYSIVDKELGRFLDRFDDALFVLVSDHGWTFSGYEHFNSPDGVVIFSGPGVKPGLELTDVGIQDIAPTLLALLGAPISKQLPGRVIDEAFEFNLTPSWVDSYRDVDMSFDTDAKVEVSEDEEQRLRDIGYVR